jgi:hypothetical protein
MGTNNGKVVDDISNSYKYREGEYSWNNQPSKRRVDINILT